MRPRRPLASATLGSLLLALVVFNQPMSCGGQNHAVADAIVQAATLPAVVPKHQQHQFDTSATARRRRLSQQANPVEEQQQATQQAEDLIRRRQAAQDRLLKAREAEKAAAEAHINHAAHEAAHARLLETQRRQAEQQAQHLAATRVKQQEEEALGRGSLRTRRSTVQAPLPIRGSRPGDVFAEQTEKRLNAARQALAARRQQQAQLLLQLEAAQAAVAAKASPQAQAVAAQAQQQRQQGGAGATGARQAHIPLLIIIVMTLVMAAAAGLGALPFFFVKSMSEAATGVATAIACGVMLAASFDLVHEGQPYSPPLTVAGVLLGGAFIRWVQQQLAAYEDIQFGALQGSSARKTVLMVGIMAAHALGEGCAVGVSFCGDRGWSQGLLTTLAIGVHNIPEGLAKATVLVGQGVGPRRALGWSILTCLPQPLVAIPSFIFVDAFTTILPVALGFAAGCMVWMVFAELLPDALERTPAAQVATAATVSAAGLEGFRMLFASMEQPGGGFGDAASAAAAVQVLASMAPQLLTLLPAVAAAAASGAGLGGTLVPAPVAWGLAAAASFSFGGGSLVEQMLYRQEVPLVHTAAATAMGVTLVLLLHRQLLAWAGSGATAAARKLLAKGGAAGGGLPAADLEAVEYASLYQQHHLHHSVHAAHPLFRANGEPQPLQNGQLAAGMSDGRSNGISGFGGSSSSLAHSMPYHRGGSLPGADPGSLGGSASGTITPNGGAVAHRQGLSTVGLLPAPQLAAVGAGTAAWIAGCVAAGWQLACSLLLLAEDRTSVMLPAVLLLAAGPGLAAGALARTLPGRSGAAPAAWLAGGLALLCAAAAALTAAKAGDSAHLAVLVKSFLYPYGTTDTAQAVAGGALVAAATLQLRAGAALKAPSAHGGLVLGLILTALLAGVRHMLCSFTPYCLSITALLNR